MKVLGSCQLYFQNRDRISPLFPTCPDRSQVQATIINYLDYFKSFLTDHMLLSFFPPQTIDSQQSNQSDVIKTQIKSCLPFIQKHMIFQYFTGIKIQSPNMIFKALYNLVLLTPLLFIIILLFSQPKPVKQGLFAISQTSRHDSALWFSVSFSLYLGVLHMANSLTYSRSFLRYHLSNNESTLVLPFMNFNCHFLHFHSLSPLPQFSLCHLSSSVIIYILLIYFLYYLYLSHCPTRMQIPQKKQFLNLSVLFIDVSTVNEYNQQ